MKILYPKLILIAGISSPLSVGFFMYRAYVSKPQVGVEAETRRKPILISGIEEPEEMRVEPFPVATLSESERMLRDEMQAVKDNNDPNALLPGLNRILKAFPDYSDGYMMRVASLCRGQDRAAILSDIDNALKFADTSRVVAKDRRDLHAALLSIRAKLKYPASDNGSLEDLYRAVHADIKSATELFNSGGIKPEKTAGDICSWNETDMDTLVQRFPNDYRPYLFRGLYYSFFAFYDPPSIPRAERDFGKAAELNPNSALPHYFLASLWRGWSINRPLAERDKLFQRDLDELSKALALDPKLNAGFYKRALVNFDLKKFQEAVSDCDKIIEVDQKNVEAYELR